MTVVCGIAWGLCLQIQRYKDIMENQMEKRTEHEMETELRAINYNADV